MGQFSWLDCSKHNDKRYAILDGVYRTSFVLVPPEFQSEFGERIAERCYEGYGVFGGYDVYDLVVDWNRQYLSTENLQGVTEPVYAEIIELLSRGATDKEIVAYLKSVDEDSLPLFMSLSANSWKRNLGIAVACYDDQNARLKYPIKITYNKRLRYEEADPSNSDPNQGWGYDYDDDIDSYHGVRNRGNKESR